MYDQIGDDTVDDVVAEKLAKHVWVDTDGNLVDEKDTFRFKVTNDMLYHAMTMMMDEICDNTNQI